MRALIRDKSVLITVGIGLILLGLTYGINGLTQGVVRVPVQFIEGQSVESAVSGVFTYNGLVEVWDVSFFESFAHRNVSSGIVAVLVGCSLLVRVRELKKNPSAGWKASALILVAAAVLPYFYAISMYTNLLNAKEIDLTATAGVVDNAWPLFFAGIALWLNRNSYRQQNTIEQASTLKLEPTNN